MNRDLSLVKSAPCILKFVKKLPTKRAKELKLGSDFMLALDCASSEFYKNGFYELSAENKILSNLIPPQNTDQPPEPQVNPVSTDDLEFFIYSNQNNEIKV